jgi:hypothetical protein
MKAQAVALKRQVRAFRIHATEEMKAAMPSVNEQRVNTGKVIVDCYGEAESIQDVASTQRSAKQRLHGGARSMASRRDEPPGAAAHAGAGKNGTVGCEEFEEF